MTMIRVVVLASILCGLALAACGGAGSGGAGTTGAPATSTPGPALGTNQPAPSKPYSEPGY
jgi:hypothetical protein